MALVQQNTGNTGSAASASYSVTLGAATTAGNTLLIVVSSDNTVSTPSGFTLDRSQINNNGHYVFRKTAVASETSWTVTPTASATGAWYVREESGLDTTTPVDQVISTGITTEVTTQSTGTTPTTSQATDFLFATIGSSKAFSGGAIGTISSWTNSFVEAGQTNTTATSGTNVGVGVAVREVTSTGAHETTATFTVLAAATGIMVAYKRAAAGRPSVRSQPSRAVHRSAIW